MAWVEVERQMAGDHVEVFGEPITLDGAAAVGIFYPRGSVDPLTEIQSPFGLGAVDPVIHPRLVVAEALLSSLAVGAAVQARGVDYALIRYVPDGAGMVICELEQALA